MVIVVKNEIYEIPYRAELCYQKNKGIILPEDVPYIGMGASNIATTAFKYLGINILPEKSAEYFNYLIKYIQPKNGVLISQSGESSETLWCADYFQSFVAVTNDENSELGKHKNCAKQVLLYSGDEKSITAKTYINSLLVLYLGFGFDPGSAITVLKSELERFEKEGSELGALLYPKMRRRRKPGIYILGNGPNTATARHVALMLSEITKVSVLSMSVSQYDHGFKETANDSVVIALNHKGPEQARTSHMLETIKKAGGDVFEINNVVADSIYSPLTFPVPFYFAAEYLSHKLKTKSMFPVGKKVIKVDPELLKDE